MITLAQLQQIIPNAGSRAGVFHGPLVATMAEFEINTPARAAAFLAQLAHESGSLRYTQEIASGDAYEGRKDLGNTQPGDGRRFKGHGLIQLTGRANHEAYAAYKGMTIDDVLAYLQTPDGAANVSGWYWTEYWPTVRGKDDDLNDLADAGDFVLITKRINGGTNGLADRQAFYERAKEVLGT